MRVGVLDRRRRLPGPERGHPGGRPQGRPTYGYEFVGFRDGWRGPLEGDGCRSTSRRCGASCPRGGTILGTSRTNPFKVEGGVDRIKENLRNARRRRPGGHRRRGHARRGGEAARDAACTSSACRRPSTTTSATDYTFGFDTAVNIAMEASTAAHDGRVAPPRADRRGDGAARGLDRAARRARRRRLHHPHPRGAASTSSRSARAIESRFQTATRRSSWSPRAPSPRTGEMIAAGRRARDAFGHVRLGGIGDWLAKEIEKRTGKEARTHGARHIQRGGTPTAFDRVLATRFGLHAIDAVHDGDWGKMVALRGTDIVRVPLSDATARAEDRRRRHAMPKPRYSSDSGRCGSASTPVPRTAPSTTCAGSGGSPTTQGFHWCSVWDHLYSVSDLSNPAKPAFEGIATMAALAARRRARARRLPGVLRRLPQSRRARQGGRHHRPPERRALRARLGAGWNEAEFRAFGMPFPPIKDRLDLLEETAIVLRRLLRRRARHLRTASSARRRRALLAAAGAEEAAALDRRSGREAPAAHRRAPRRRLERAVPGARALRARERDPRRLVREGAARSARDHPHLNLGLAIGARRGARSAQQEEKLQLMFGGLTDW